MLAIYRYICRSYFSEWFLFTSSVLLSSFILGLFLQQDILTRMPVSFSIVTRKTDFLFRYFQYISDNTTFSPQYKVGNAYAYATYCYAYTISVTYEITMFINYITEKQKIFDRMAFMTFGFEGESCCKMCFQWYLNTNIK